MVAVEEVETYNAEAHESKEVEVASLFFRLGLPNWVLGYLIKEFQEGLVPCAYMVPRQRNSETCFGDLEALLSAGRGRP